MLLFLAFLSLFVQANSVPIFEKETQKFFASDPHGSGDPLEKVASTLQELSQLAKKEFLGVSDGPIDVSQERQAEDRNTIVSISQNQPGISLSVSKFLFEGDILLTPKQARQILEGFKKTISDDRNRRFKRKFHRTYGDDWNEFPIKYKLIGSLKYDQEPAEQIHTAIREWEKHTCLTFQHVTHTDDDDDYLEFFRGRGCYSMVGKIGGGQAISIGYGCEKIGIIAHEVGHALGMWHEQSRVHRDDHIKINFENILSGTLHNFIKLRYDQMNSFGVPYDLGSIMHYGPFAFTKDWSKRSITTNYPGYQRTIGQREHLSFYDIKIINKAYCDDKCRYKYRCQHGGYMNPKTCYECLCPDGFGGYTCERHEYGKNAYCGGTVHLGLNPAFIKSPNYPDKFDLDRKCSWLIKAPKGKLVFLEFVGQFHFHCPSTCSDYVEIKNSTDFGRTGMRYCCDQKPSSRIYGSTHEMMVIFNSKLVRDTGFKALVYYYPEEETYWRYLQRLDDDHIYTQK